MNGYETPPIVGPRPIGQLVAIARGAYTEITQVIAPASASQGDLVSIEVQVRNLYSTPIYIAVTGRYDGIDILFSPDYVSVGAGATYSFTSSFSMPNNDVRLHVWSFYWAEPEWYQDDYGYVDVALKEAVEPYTGTISRMELEYDELRAAIPAYGIPQNQRGLVHIWGRNDMSNNQKMGINWIVRDPDGRIVEEYAGWETLWTGPGNAQEFIGGRFYLDKPGTYTINIALSMNPDDPEIVDSYYGTLCTVAAAVPEPEFRGFGVSEYQAV